MSTIFLTGATGLLGRALLDRLLADGHQVRALSRAVRAPRPNLSWVLGDLCDAGAYAPSCSDVDVVIHAAAQTGNAPDAEYERVNVEGTRALLGVAEAAKVRRFIHTSTVAVTYPELDEYPYARSKRAADELVSASRLEEVTIVRPTILLGSEGPALQHFLALARFPFVILAPGASVVVRPIHVEDAATSIVSLLARGPREVDLAGPDALRFDELLARLREKAGRGSAPILPIPVKPFIEWVSRAERIAKRLPRTLPVRAGQLYVFKYGATLGVAPKARALEVVLDELLGSLLGPELEQEALRLAEYLAHRRLGGSQLSAYAEAAKSGLLSAVGGRNAADELFGLLARSGFVRPADLLARFFRPAGELRRRLVMLLAILEVDPHARAKMDSPSSALAFIGRARAQKAKLESADFSAEGPR
ncbi:MAG: NAD(P)H-binding protein [Deltaproteobacteria bacterium]|nr:NAD(P)H-binding protein [Deltaproteobacteria bacterium]